LSLVWLLPDVYVAKGIKPSLVFGQFDIPVRGMISFLSAMINQSQDFVLRKVEKVLKP
jgi:hypothetical protein